MQVIPLPLPLDPRALYLQRLRPGKSRDTMARMLDAAQAWGCCRWQDWTYSKASTYREALRARLSPASVNLHLCALRGVLREAARLEPHARAGLLEACELAGLRNAVLPAGRALAASEVQTLWLAGKTRQRAILAILYGAGLREEEAVRLEVADFDPTARTLRVDGKGGKERLVPVPRFARFVEAWLLERGPEPGPLLCPVTRGGRVVVRRMSERGLAKGVARMVAAAGLAHASPHDLRRTCITALLDAGADLGAVQDFAGHANVQTTRRYDRRGERAKVKAAELLYAPEGP
jgi:integrase